jgi:hypothetical protein
VQPQSPSRKHSVARGSVKRAIAAASLSENWINETERRTWILAEILQDS